MSFLPRQQNVFKSQGLKFEQIFFFNMILFQFQPKLFGDQGHVSGSVFSPCENTEQQCHLSLLRADSTSSRRSSRFCSCLYLM